MRILLFVICFLLYSGLINADDEASIPKTSPKADAVIEEKNEESVIQNIDDIKSSPVIYVPINRYEFPTILEGKQIEYDFIVKNNGSSTLEIQKVKTG